MRLGITMLDDAAAVSRWPDENTAGIVSFGEHIALKPSLDDGLRTDVLAMALIVAAVMGDCAIGHPCAITAPGRPRRDLPDPRSPARTRSRQARYAACPQMRPGHRICRI